MARRKDTPAMLQQKRSMILDRVKGQPSASSTGLSASFGLDVIEVRKLLQRERVRDDG